MLRKLTAIDAVAFRTLRRQALAGEPQAFGESVEEWDRFTIEDVERRLDADPSESFVLGAFEQETLAGTAGIYRELRMKRRHHAGVWGVYVAPAHRGRGLARELMVLLIEEARQMAGVESLHLTVALGQTVAHRLYQSLGFRSYGVEQRALKTSAGYVDEDHLVLRLDRA